MIIKHVAGWKYLEYEVTDSEVSASKRKYMLGSLRPNYPVPALPTPTFNSLVELGSITAENGWPVECVFDLIPITRRN